MFAHQYSMKNEKLRMKNSLDVDYIVCTSSSQRLRNSSFFIESLPITIKKYLYQSFIEMAYISARFKIASDQLLVYRMKQ